MAETDGDKAIQAMQGLIAKKASQISSALVEFFNGRLEEVAEQTVEDCEGHEADCENYVERSRDAAVKIEECAQYLVLMTMVIDGRANLPDGVVQNILMPMLPEETQKSMRNFILERVLTLSPDTPPDGRVH